jgi:hypothetical protein
VILLARYHPSDLLHETDLHHTSHEAMELLLTTLVETTSDAAMLQYQQAILFYSPQLDQTWDAE